MCMCVCVCVYVRVTNLWQLLISPLQQFDRLLKEHMDLTLLSTSGQVQAIQLIGIVIATLPRKREGYHRQLVLLVQSMN